MIALLKVLAHLLAFVFSIWFYWAFTYIKSTDLMVALITLMYVGVFNLSRREILPSVLILMAFTLFNFAGQRLVYLIYGHTFAAAAPVLIVETVFHLFFSIVIFYYHCSPKLLAVVRSDIRRSFIPQSIGISFILFLSVWPYFVALCEVALYHYDNTIFSGPPFFYRNYELFKSISHTMIMLGVWSMMLDAHYLKERLQRKISA